MKQEKCVCWEISTRNCPIHQNESTPQPNQESKAGSKSAFSPAGGVGEWNPNQEGKEKWIEIARKYIPDLTNEQADLIRRIASCKRYGEDKLKYALTPSALLGEVECGCSLCIQVAVSKLNQKDE